MVDTVSTEQKYAALDGAYDALEKFALNSDGDGDIGLRDDVTQANTVNGQQRASEPQARTRPTLNNNDAKKLILEILRKDLAQADVEIDSDTRTWKFMKIARLALVVIAVVLVVWLAVRLMLGFDVSDLVGAAGAIVSTGAALVVNRYAKGAEKALEKKRGLREKIQARVEKLSG